MIQQMGLFDAPPAPARTGGAPPGVRQRYELAFSEPVMLELELRLAEFPGRWLAWRDFDDIRERHQIGFCLGHVLGRMVRDGRALEHVYYFGAKEFSIPGAYEGFGTKWSTMLQGPPAP